MTPKCNPVPPHIQVAKSVTLKALLPFSLIHLSSADLIGYWPLDETAGDVAADLQDWDNNPAFILSSLENSETPNHALATYVTPAPLPGKRLFIRLHLQTD